MSVNCTTGGDASYEVTLLGQPVFMLPFPKGAQGEQSATNLLRGLGLSFISMNFGTVTPALPIITEIKCNHGYESVLEKCSSSIANVVFVL